GKHSQVPEGSPYHGRELEYRQAQDLREPRLRRRHRTPDDRGGDGDPRRRAPAEDRPGGLRRRRHAHTLAAEAGDQGAPPRRSREPPGPARDLSGPRVRPGTADRRARQLLRRLPPLPARVRTLDERRHRARQADEPDLRFLELSRALDLDEELMK